jgi:hypothetical protein
MFAGLSRLIQKIRITQRILTPVHKTAVACSNVAPPTRALTNSLTDHTTHIPQTAYRAELLLVRTSWPTPHHVTEQRQRQRRSPILQMHPM